jgi:dUTP pyrophosphatase
MVIARFEHITWNEVETLSETLRGEGGFGHTGVK